MACVVQQSEPAVSTAYLRPKLARVATTATASTTVSDACTTASCSGDESAAPISRNMTASALTRHALSTEYPEDLLERNTFLDIPLYEPAACLSLRLRRVRSAPCIPMVCDMQHERERPFTSAESLQSAVSAQTNVPDNRAVVALASMLSGPVLGSPEMPTVGSQPHYLGGCKPCAFVAKPEGCSNGVQCLFCHLCDVGEKKRRQKAKKAMFKAQYEFYKRSS
eukprot:TRINITY_DN73595_c0_g1_i1.p1 TRINITY_DN73595_c0_g1~~TRINITY_DN73595_c0_g1_i1.p1  ORF type:complete len:223 (-),score=22.57 TRINITY_DN73595_c0_g1_i1:310-978(-)